jgi:polysaccharide pyruvyl transferase WcaK-like protein
MKRKTVALLGPFGLGNLGDAATQDAALVAIRRNWPDTEVIGVSLDPADTRERHGIRTLPIRANHANESGLSGRMLWVLRELAFAFRSIWALRGVDVLVVSGGGQLDDAWGGAGAHPFALFKWSLFARLAGASVYYLSVGAGPVYSRKSEQLLNRALRLARYRSYRDERSRELVRKQLRVADPGQVVPDLAHTRFDPQTARDPGYDELRVVGVAPMPHFDPRMAPYPGPDPARFQAYLEKLASFVKWLLTERQCTVVFFVGEIHQDEPVVDDVLRILERQGVDVNSPTVKRPKIRTVAELGECLADMQIVVASRFHSVLLPLALARPVVALTYHPKVTELMRDMGQTEYCLDIDAFQIGELISGFESLWAKREATRNHLLATSAEYRSRIQNQYNLAFPAAKEGRAA